MSNDIAGLVLAGGKGSRIGGVDKGLINFNNKPLVSYSLKALRPCVKTLFISANNHIKQYQQYAPVIQDELVNFQGPLAGIHIALKSIKADYLVILPCDTPFITHIIVKKLIRQTLLKKAKIGLIYDGKKLQPTITIIHTSLATDLNCFLLSNKRKLFSWQQQHQPEIIHILQPKLFININTQEDIDNFSL